MIRLPFRLPEWAPRITWTSTKAREVWEPRITRVSNAYLEAERQAVVTGVRPSALQNATPDELPDLTRRMATHGLVVLPLGKTARPLAYASARRDLVAGEPFDYRVAITRPNLAETWTEAWAKSNDAAIGGLLGFPDCCRVFFQKVWVEEKWIDTTFRMGENSTQKTGVNMLWRWFGVRPVSHLPCAADCQKSVEQEKQMLALLPDPERLWAIEMLSWPALWSSLHGIAEITTPIFRASVPTDALATKAEVRYEGIRYPAEGAKGITFPYRKTVPIVIPRPSLKNGFMSDEAMNAAHDVLLDTLTNTNRVRWQTAIDLGCGDGTLLRRIPAKRKIGVEQDHTKQPEGLDRTILADCTFQAFVDILMAEEKPDLVIAQKDRNPPEMFKDCDVLSYSYEGGQTTAQLIRR